jgi:hypothetical protein
VKLPYATSEARRLYRNYWRRANPEKSSEYSVNYRLRHPERTLLIQARARSKKKEIHFDLAEKDIVIPENCPVFGFKLEWNLGKGAGGQANSISLDRIDNNKGYIPGNVQVISSLANRMKAAATPEQLVQFAQWVLK